jgi:hypothetical protein
MLCRKQYHKVTINNETGVFAYQSEKVETKNLKLNCEKLQIETVSCPSFESSSTIWMR